MLGNVLLRLTL